MEGFWAFEVEHELELDADDVGPIVEIELFFLLRCSKSSAWSHGTRLFALTGSNETNAPGCFVRSDEIVRCWSNKISQDMRMVG